MLRKRLEIELRYWILKTTHHIRKGSLLAPLLSKVDDLTGLDRIFFDNQIGLVIHCRNRVLLAKAIADTPLSKQIIRLSGVILNLATKIMNVDL